MTKDIILTISGLHATDGDSDGPVEIMTPAQYYLKNGKHYLLFEEVLEGLEGKIKSTIKFTDDKVELVRTGAASTRMVFERDREHTTVYQTAMGPLYISIYTEDLTVEITEEQMNLHIDYLLKSGDEVITESTVTLNACPKELKQFKN